MTIIYFALILGVIVFIHELGHFIFAKKAGIYVYEFSIGMGPKLFKFNRKNDETVYSIRLFPIGGFVQMAGEEIEVDEKIPAEKRMQAKTWIQRFSTIIAGVVFNFVLAIILLFIVALINGAPNNVPYISSVEDELPAYLEGIEVGDLITTINGKKINSIDHLLLELEINKGKTIELGILKKNTVKESVILEPIKLENDGNISYLYGFSLDTTIEKGILVSIKYAFFKTGSLIMQMFYIIGYLITGALGLDNLSGPVGIYNVVGDSAKAGFVNIVYLTAFISINVGVINLLPIPAFDGGRILFLIIEKIKKGPVNQKIENAFHAIGFVLLMALMLFITYNDIIKIFR